MLDALLVIKLKQCNKTKLYAITRIADANLALVFKKGKILNDIKVVLCWCHFVSVDTFLFIYY